MVFFKNKLFQLTFCIFLISSVLILVLCKLHTKPSKKTRWLQTSAWLAGGVHSFPNIFTCVSPSHGNVYGLPRSHAWKFPVLARLEQPRGCSLRLSPHFSPPPLLTICLFSQPSRTGWSYCCSCPCW